MELVYLWVEKYKNIIGQGFNFSPRFKCEYDGEKLTVNENKDYVSIFPNNINVTAIVGENGSGKSSIFEFLINEITKPKSYICVVFNKEEKKLQFTTNNQIIRKKNKNYEYIESDNLHKYWGYMNFSPHENTIKDNRIVYFGMASDEFSPSKFDEYLKESKKELTTTQNIKFQQLLNEVKKFVFINTNNHKYSSGEKALLYYLINLYNILEKESNLIVFIDEIELFLHPMWQKRVIKIFIECLQNKITKNIHIVIASHSPFLISDIPKENVIFLKNGKQEKPFKENEQTFGANIHTLLSHGFFMDGGLMGEFAKSKITEIINIFKKPQLSEDEIKDCKHIISIIGEPILQKTLEHQLNAKLNPNETELQKLEREKEEIQERIDKLTGKTNETN